DGASRRRRRGVGRGGHTQGAPICAHDLQRRHERRPAAAGLQGDGRSARSGAVARRGNTLEQSGGRVKVGLLCGREYSFPPAFLDRVNTLGRPHGITAEFVKLTGTKMGEPSGYRVIVDRISHEVEYFRAYLKHAVLHGTYVINNPFWWTADDKFFNY